MGVTGEWPPRVGADVKGAALDLVEAATEDGWSARRACATLELDERRWRRWRARSAAGCLDDGAMDSAGAYVAMTRGRKTNIAIGTGDVQATLNI